MKFRAKMTDALCMKHYANIISTLARLSKSCVLRLCVDKMYFIVSEDSVVSRGPMVWCILDQSHFFDYYKMEGVSLEENEIFLDFQADMLAKSLSSLKMSQPQNDHVRSVKMKLTNKISPCLTFEIELPSFSHSRLCVHDIPVEVIPRRQWYNYEEPKLPTFDVSIDMPSLKLVRNIVERMKTFSPLLNIKVSNDGTYIFQVENDTVNIATTFKDLLVENLSNDDEDDIVVSARVDIKKFILFLASEQLNPSKIVCNVVDEKLVHMFLSHEDLILHYFLNAVVI